ncbi:hypothetical protein [Leptospira santarosai]|uniref:hypothetical protein n=1 Tax=Leptospira santarosai TaxID=28183 RepID=UPI0007741707|nr:hypothetical protein [Leptospira santarosai]MDI7191484.1 hypothetical protein [Leptospira santarosai]MDI7212234.1 hypothetical protein [Leptospira santarosai]MDI7215781.1 hypothetical protein [Leptospira santarosai]MDI7223060.1 hypothetical protein [Leptospira santarosai]
MKEKILNSDNIAIEIEEYLEKIKEIPLTIHSENFTEFYRILKRNQFESGPYPKVSLFEGINRIMSDLVILYGIKTLLDVNSVTKHNLPFAEYTVQFGVTSKKPFDITSKLGNRSLAGEAFNVAPSFFAGKKSRELKKFKESTEKYSDYLLIYNSEATDSTSTFELIDDILHLRVKLPDL